MNTRAGAPGAGYALKTSMFLACFALFVATMVANAAVLGLDRRPVPVPARSPRNRGG